MWKLLSLIQQQLIWSIPAAMIAGILFGVSVDPSFLKATIIPLTFLMVYPMMINLQVKEVFSGGDYKVQIVTQLINFAVIPFFDCFVSQWFFHDQPLIALGLLLSALLPTSGMTISWTGFAKGNVSAAIKRGTYLPDLMIGLIVAEIILRGSIAILRDQASVKAS